MRGRGAGSATFPLLLCLSLGTGCPQLWSPPWVQPKAAEHVTGYASPTLQHCSDAKELLSDWASGRQVEGRAGGRAGGWRQPRRLAALTCTRATRLRALATGQRPPAAWGVRARCARASLAALPGGGRSRLCTSHVLFVLAVGIRKLSPSF